jgi:hypothetical protein
MSVFTKIYEFFNNPRTALFIMLIFFLVYYLSIGLTVGFGNNFLSFGPKKDKDGNYTHFMGIQLSSWKLVGVVYVIIFITTVLQSYYQNVVGQNIHGYVWNTAVQKVPYSKFWTYLVLLVDPFINILLSIIRFYATATFQIQYVIPQFIGSYITDLPFTLKWLSGKKFIS